MCKLTINNKEISFSAYKSLTSENFTKFTLNSLLGKKLYKFFSSVTEDNGENHSIDALKTNTIYLSSPEKFNDPFDSQLCILSDDFYKKTLSTYASFADITFEANNLYDMIREFSIKIKLRLKETKQFHSIFNIPPLKQDRSNEKLYYKLNMFVDFLMLNFNLEIEVFLKNFLEKEKQNFYERNIFGCACFTTNHYNRLMWSHYANSYKGFCIEYTMPNDLSNFKEISEHDRYLWANILPVAYSNRRVDLTDSLIKQLLYPLTDEQKFELYKYEILLKDAIWSYENEWRFIDTKDKTIKFFPISAVYLGHKMDEHIKSQIIQIAFEKNINIYECILQEVKYEIEFKPLET